MEENNNIYDKYTKLDIPSNYNIFINHIHKILDDLTIRYSLQLIFNIHNTHQIHNIYPYFNSILI